MLNSFASLEFHKAVETSLTAERKDVINQLNKLYNYILQSIVNLHFVGIKNDKICKEEWESLKNEQFPPTQHQVII